MRLLDAKEVAEILQVNTQRVYELTRQGILPSIRIGARQIRFEEERLLRWIENGGRIETISLQDHESDNNSVEASSKQRVAAKSLPENADTRHPKVGRRSALLPDALRGSEPSTSHWSAFFASHEYGSRSLKVKLPTSRLHRLSG